MQCNDSFNLTSYKWYIAGGVNRSLVTQQWVLIGVNNTTEVYATQVNISDGITQIMHTDATAQIMVIVHGFNTVSWLHLLCY